VYPSPVGVKPVTAPVVLNDILAAPDIAPSASAAPDVEKEILVDPAISVSDFT
jgi:hypothetical protein